MIAKTRSQTHLLVVAMEVPLQDSTAKVPRLANMVSSPNTALPQVSNLSTVSSHSTELLRVDEEDHRRASTEPRPNKVVILAVPRSRVTLLRADVDTLRARRLLTVIRWGNGDLGLRSLNSACLFAEGSGCLVLAG
jgi:hypothetical protein